MTSGLPRFGGPAPLAAAQNAPAPAPMVMAWPTHTRAWTGKEGLLATDELSEEARSLRDARRAFAVGGSTLIFLLALAPAWGALALLRNPTYKWFSEPNSFVGPLLLIFDLIVLIWLAGIGGIRFPAVTCPNPLVPILSVLRVLPAETYVMGFLTVFLLVIWKVIPYFWFHGFEIALSWFGRFLDVFSMMCFSTDPAAAILALCFSMVMLYMLSLSYFFKRSEGRGKVGTMFGIWTAFVALLGIGFVFSSMPVTSGAKRSYDAILGSCDSGDKTKGLYSTSQALQAIRQTPGCQELDSVESCVGYQANKYTDFLKTMEADLRCAGFCYNAAALESLAGQPPAAAQAVTMPNAYPPTLFSKDNYQASCDGTAARGLRNFVMGVSTQILQEGAALLCIGICLSLLYCKGICNGELDTTRPMDLRAAYGSTQ